MKSINVDEYIADSPKEVQKKLIQIRYIINKVAPGSLEKISYGIPYYGYKGRLVYFAYYKKHIGLYIPPPVVENHKKELKEFKISKSTIQFPLDRDLPVALIKKLVKERKELNELKKGGELNGS